MQARSPAASSRGSSHPRTQPSLFGRTDELAALDAAWDDTGINLLSVVAWGEVGKTALVNRWLLDLAEHGYRGAARVFGWSFYSQGAAEGRQTSADLLIEAARARRLVEETGYGRREGALAALEFELGVGVGSGDS